MTGLQGVRRWVVAHRIQIFALIFWLMLVMVARVYMQQNGMTVPELVESLRSVLVNAWYGPLLYIIAYLLRPLILFPASWLTALAGNIFGLGLGFVYAMIAGTLSAGFPYVVGRWFAGDEAATQESDSNRLRRFVGAMRRNPFQTVLTMRLLYLPYDAVSLLAGSLRLPFVAFALATIIGNIGGTLVYVALGASVDGDLTANTLSFDPVLIAFSVVVMVLSIAISRLLRGRGGKSTEDNSEQRNQSAMNINEPIHQE